MEFAIIVIAVTVVLVVVVAVMRRPGAGAPDRPLGEPRSQAEGERGDRRDITPYPGQGRPAGPGAESQRAQEAGDPMPGTSQAPPPRGDAGDERGQAR